MPETNIPIDTLSILDHLHESVLISNKNNVIVYINYAYTRVTGIPRDELIGRKTDEARPGSKMAEVMRTGKPVLGYHRVLGNREWVANVVPIYLDGKIIGGASIVNNAQDILNLSRELESYRRNMEKLQKRIDTLASAKFNMDDIIAVDEQSLRTKEVAERIAVKNVPVLILGESGTGKEVYAHAIHRASPRRSFPFLAINCAALSPNLLESELFGYVDGAFTGGRKGGNIGIFESADGGTVFLDEIGDMDIYAQAKLLRVIQEEVVRPVGGNHERKVDVRVIAATNRNLGDMIDENRFRLDLFYRISSFTLQLPPLRERRADIIPLAEAFLTLEGVRNHKNYRFSESALASMREYDWPGNIRELQNVVRTAAALADGDLVEASVFPPILRRSSPEVDDARLPSLRAAVRNAEMQTIRKALGKYGNTTEGKKLAAKALGISIATLYNKLNQTNEGDV